MKTTRGALGDEDDKVGEGERPAFDVILASASLPLNRASLAVCRTRALRAQSVQTFRHLGAKAPHYEG
eukprot:2784387-Pleurochrysis_carterae.AAC.1